MSLSKNQSASLILVVRFRAEAQEFTICKPVRAAEILNPVKIPEAVVPRMGFRKVEFPQNTRDDALQGLAIFDVQHLGLSAVVYHSDAR